MPIQFRFAQMTIEHFRGIKNLTLDLPPRIPTYLVGPNNSGKSTVLNALALALRGGGFHTFNPQAFDFFHDGGGNPSSEFRIDLSFEAETPEHLPAVQGVGNPVVVHGIRVLGRTSKEGRFQHRHVLVDENQKAIVLSPRTPLKGELKTIFRDHNLGWAQYYARLDDIAKHLPQVWFIKPDNLSRSLYAWQTGPLRRLSRLLSERFLHTEWEFEFEGEVRRMPSTLNAAHDFFKACVAEFPFWKDELKPSLEDALGTYLGRTARLGLQPDILVLEEWIQQQLAVSVSAEVGGPLTPLPSMGDGWQALVRLAALEVLANYEESSPTPVMLLCEEPEVYLHPHLRRKLKDVLGRLAGQGWLVVSATHASEFISFQVPQHIVRLWKNEDDTGRGHLLTEDITEATKFQEKLEEHGNHEVVLANRVILCEGKDDVFASNTYLDKSDVDMDALGVTVLGVGGCGSLPDYARMASSLGIPWCALTDEDLLPDGSVKPATALARKLLAEIASAKDIIPMWPKSLESCLGCNEAKATPEWQYQNIASKMLEQLRSDHPRYSSTCDKIIAWLEG